MTEQMTSREFNQDTSRAKKASERGPVYITDHGRPAHVLLTYEAYEQILGAQHGLHLLCQPPGIEDIKIDYELPTAKELARSAEFE